MATAQSQVEESKRGLVVKIGVAVLAILGAGYFEFLRGNPENEQLDTPESAAPYACRSCGHGMLVTPAEFDRLLQQGAMGADGAERGRSALRCPKCQKMAIRRGVRCPKDGQIFLPVKDGKTVLCPQCKWRPPENY